MLTDTEIDPSLATATTDAGKAEAEGYDGIWASEIAHDPMFALLLAATNTDTIDLATGITVAFARSPMTLAMSSWDLNAFSRGRFTLGLGSQVKPHIERRFSMPWGQPAARMREFVQALQSIWGCWQDGTELAFEGEFYRHTLMTPFFNPGPNEFGAPKVVVAAVGEGMTRVAGEVADGMIVHGFTTERYLREVTLPGIEAGLAGRGKTRADFTMSYPALVATGDTLDELSRAERGTRKQIAFYGSTPAYKGILEHHGWGDLQPELHRLSREDRWDDMADVIDDEVLNTFAVVAPTEDVPELLQKRFGDIIDRIRLYLPYDTDASDPRPRIVAGLKRLG